MRRMLFLFLECVYKKLIQPVNTVYTAKFVTFRFTNFPSKDYFDYIFIELGINDLGKVVIVGDSLTSDMQGGRNAGITTCLFNPKGDIKESPLCDYIIRDYDEFFRII